MRGGRRPGVLTGPVTVAEVFPASRGPEEIGRDDNSGWLSWSSPSSVFSSWAASRPGTIRPRSTNPCTCPPGWRPSSITTWRTMRNTHRCSRCWPRCLSWPSARSSPPTGTGMSTTSAPIAPASSRPRYRRAPCAASRSPPGWCRCWSAALVALALYGLASLLFGPWSGVVAALLWLLDPWSSVWDTSTASICRLR